MKAVKARKYGSPEVLEIIEIKKPTPKENEVLVKVSHSVVTPTDYTGIKGSPFIVRFFSGLTKPKNVTGDVFVGEVEEVGSSVNNFKKGDRVFGSLAPTTGTHAEYIVIKSEKVIAKAPKNLSDVEAASLVDGPLTAHADLKKHAHIKEGYNVLINGASGSVGSAAVQLAKYFGATVTGVCSTKNLEFVKSIGADRVVDYTKEDFTQLDDKFDIIFDTVYKSSFGACKKILTEKGRYLATGPKLSTLVYYFITRFTKKKASMPATGPFWKQEELELISRLAEEGVLKPIVDSTYKLEQIKDAFEFVGKGHKVGSVVVEI